MKYTKPKAEVVDFEAAPIILSSMDWDLLPEVTMPEDGDFDFYE